MNKNKSLPLILGIIAIIIALGVVFAQYSAKDSQPASYTPTTSTDQSSTTVKDTTTTTEKPTPVTPKPNQYTLAQIATHNTRSNCWTTINGGVYNVTAWINQHPGGAEAIISLCGIDGSAAFNGQHGGQARPASELATFKIGTLIK